MTDSTDRLTRRESLLAIIEGGERHQRQKVGDSNALPYHNFVAVGQTLRACSKRAPLVEELLDKLAPHRDVIIGVLPPGVQSHGLVPDLEQELSDEQLLSRLEQISDAEVRQWVIQDCSLIYGELTQQELKSYFLEAGKLLKHPHQFIDLGSGLGKVVMSAALSLPFSSCIGVELMPYRHQLALQRFEQFCAALQLPDNALAVEPQTDDAPFCDADHLRQIPQRVRFEMADMLECDLSQASLIFMYSTCFGSIMHKIADKLANDAPEGCLVSVTTYSLNHPGFRLVKHFAAKTLAWTDVRFYERIGQGPWPVQKAPLSSGSGDDAWRSSARALLV